MNEKTISAVIVSVNMLTIYVQAICELLIQKNIITKEELGKTIEKVNTNIKTTFFEGHC
jgi:hypothetical protein